MLDLLDDRIELAAAGPGAEDFKTRLQEVVLRRIGELPRYEVEGTGPDHARRYRARVLGGGRRARCGRGPVEEGRRAGRGPRGLGACWSTMPTAIEAGDRRAGDRGRPTEAAPSEGAGQCLSSPRSRPSAGTSTKRS